MDAVVLQRNNLFVVPVHPYSMEFAAYTRMAFCTLQPTCVAVDLPCTMAQAALHAAARLPDPSVISIGTDYVMVEPCDARFEALRSSLERACAAYCIGETLTPLVPFPDSYCLARIGLHRYYEAVKASLPKHPLTAEQLEMARRLKELSLRYSRVLFVADLLLAERLLEATQTSHFPQKQPQEPQAGRVYALTENSLRQVMAECGWISRSYEWVRVKGAALPDRQIVLYRLLTSAKSAYEKRIGTGALQHSLRVLMKFLRNYALLHEQLMPSLYQLVEAAKACVDDNFGYLTWELATHYPQKNVDGLPELDLSPTSLWHASKQIRFRPRQQSQKGNLLSVYARRHRKEHRPLRKTAPKSFAICSYPPEDVVIEQFGLKLKKQHTLLNTRDTSQSLPFTAGFEEGLDVRETLRHWYRRQLYIQTTTPPCGPAGSVVLIFDLDVQSQERYPWRTCWHGENGQESDMAFYATDMHQDVVGPGISRCYYGGFLMTYPPGRLLDVWNDADYACAQNKAEVLTMAAVDYSVNRPVVYVAATPPRESLKYFATSRGKRLIYIPIGQLAPVLIAKIQTFHVLDGHDRRKEAGEYI